MKTYIHDAGDRLRPADKYDAPRLMADKAPVDFHVMIKPAGSACNLGCTYCFYLSKAGLPDGPGCSRMSHDTLELLIRSYIRDVTAGEVVFTWQGGEPNKGFAMESEQRSVLA
jgi:sulfatase maturation enzyme AslB (radical SAM superfamily)